MSLLNFCKTGIDTKIKRQKQTIEDQKKILEHMEKELTRLEKLKEWVEKNG